MPVRSHGTCGLCARRVPSALTAGTRIPRLFCVLSKLATAIVFCLVGLGAGYAVWGSHMGGLTGSINQTVLGEDTLRTRLAAESSEQDKAVLASALGELAEQLRAHSARIAEQAEAIDRMSGASGESISDALRACSDREALLEHNLETCLFEKAGIARDAEAARAKAPLARSGVSPIERTVTLPMAADPTDTRR